MPRLVQLTLHKEELSFSAGHFTIFSATEREHLHGHNYSVSVALTVNLAHEGLSFDYRHYKKKIMALCEHLDRHFLLPQHSPYLRIEDQEDYWVVHFNQEKIPFLKKDVVILPLTNITIEELSHWFLGKILENPTDIAQHGIRAMTVHVYNGPGQSGGSSWSVD